MLIEARSSVGPIAFGATALSGTLRGALAGDEIDTSLAPVAQLAIPVAALTSGNTFYDAELRGRLDARRFPDIEAELSTAEPLGAARFAVTGSLTIHGTSRVQQGTVEVAVTRAGAGSAPLVLVSGTQHVDIRDFDIELPSVLMLQIYPEVTVRFRLAAQPVLEDA